MDPVRSSVQLQRVLFCGLKKLQASPYVPHKRGMQRGTGGGSHNEVAVVASNAADMEGPRPPHRVGARELVLGAPALRGPVWSDVRATHSHLRQAPVFLVGQIIAPMGLSIPRQPPEEEEDGVGLRWLGEKPRWSPLWFCGAPALCTSSPRRSRIGAGRKPKGGHRETGT
ncbi:hypothetical protein NHX12_018950 [Muraenolepis orangiensis]|uniref:Uncharacterized protein n=1 Tax=Muraenolepis orangiensis TaxID=630683 RepID=A0A9Q0EXY9_9TELE|nr:hypothetical protein NHX12_018950 [Muraenolepis orangiensis]